MRTSIKTLLGPVRLEETLEQKPGRWRKGAILVYKRKKLVAVIDFGKLYDKDGMYFEEQMPV